MTTLAAAILSVTLLGAVVLSVLARRVTAAPGRSNNREVLRTAVRLDAAAFGVFVVGSLAAGLTASL